MGLYKKQIEENHQEDELKDFFTRLLEMDELKDPLRGIAKQLISLGSKTLTEKQLAIVDKYVETFKNNVECSNCENINVNGLLDYLHIVEDGMCIDCRNSYEKMMRE